MRTTNSLKTVASRLSKFVVESGQVFRSTRLFSHGPLVFAEKITPSLLNNQYQFEVIFQLKTNVLKVQTGRPLAVRYQREFRALVKYHGSDTIFAETEDGDTRKILPGNKIGIVLSIPVSFCKGDELPQHFIIYKLADCDHLVIEERVAPFIL